MIVDPVVAAAFSELMLVPGFWLILKGVECDVRSGPMETVPWGAAEELFRPPQLRRRALLGAYFRAVLGLFVLVIGLPLCAVDLYAEFTKPESLELTSLLFPVFVAGSLIYLVAREVTAVFRDEPIVLQGIVLGKGRFSFEGPDFGGFVKQAYEGRPIDVEVAQAMTLGSDGSTKAAPVGRQTIPVTWRVHRRVSVDQEIVLLCTSAGRGVATRAPEAGVVFPAALPRLRGAPASE